jgi:hypothetical protein
MLSVFTVWVNCSALADLIKITEIIEWEEKKIRIMGEKKTNKKKKKKKKRYYCKSRMLSLFISAAVLLSLSC